MTTTPRVAPAGSAAYAGVGRSPLGIWTSAPVMSLDGSGGAGAVARAVGRARRLAYRSAMGAASPAPRREERLLALGRAMRALAAVRDAAGLMREAAVAARSVTA